MTSRSILRFFGGFSVRKALRLTEEAYYERYLGFDDRGAFITGLRENNRPISDAKLMSLSDAKPTTTKTPFAITWLFFRA